MEETEIANWDFFRKQRRAKVIYLNESDVLDFVVTHEGQTRVKRILLPNDHIVHSAYKDERRQSFALIIISGDFEPIPIGGVLPELSVSEDWYIEGKVEAMDKNESEK